MGVTADERLLESPPAVERRLFTNTDPWRVLRIMGEFVDGFDELADVGKAVSIFESARAKLDDEMFALAKCLGKASFAITTGAGPGKISPRDLDRFVVMDDPEAVARFISRSPMACEGSMCK